MTSHTCNTKRNVLTPFVKSNPSEANPDVFDVSETANLIIGLQKNTSQFDGLDKEFIDLKDVIVKDLQIENHHLREKKINDREGKIISLKIKHYSLGRSDRRKNIETKATPDRALDQDLEQRVVETLKRN